MWWILVLLSVIHVTFAAGCDQALPATSYTFKCSDALDAAHTCSSAGFNTQNAWCSKTTNPYDFIEAAFSTPHRITKVSVRGDPFLKAYFPSFYIAYMVPTDTSRIKFVMTPNNSNKRQLFAGAGDASSVASANINVTVIGVFVVPTYPTPKATVCASVELYGCAETITASCSLNNGGCKQICTDSSSGPVCSCQTGYKLSGKDCILIDNCAVTPAPCTGQFEQCKNAVGSYSCVCLNGYKRDSGTNKCVQIDNCAVTPAPCTGQFEQCQNLVGSYKCVCQSGYKRDSGTNKCVLIDNCAVTPPPCSGQFEECKNAIGSFSCVCKFGYKRDSGTNKCVLIDNCAVTPAPCSGAHEKCQNGIGTFTCVCVTGYRRDSVSKKCVDIDECAADPNLCDKSVSTCQNTDGSYKCVCNTGFRKGSNGLCQDIDECKEGTPCSGKQNTKCVNTFGSFLCNCLTGYQKDSMGVCQDKDECKQNPPVCDLSTSTCENTPGSYNCNCNSGYQKDAKGVCQDIDECALTPSKCDLTKSTCVNFIGGFRCECKAGYVKDTHGSCIARQCQKLTAPSNGKVTPDACAAGAVDYKTTCNFACNTGYQLSSTSTSTATCRADGQWEFESGKFSPTCEQVTTRCPKVNDVANAVILHVDCKTLGAPVGQECKVFCNGGFDIFGTASIKCLSTGQYDGSLAGTLCVPRPTITCKDDFYNVPLPFGQKDMTLKYTGFTANVPKTSVKSTPAGILDGTGKFTPGTHDIKLTATSKAGAEAHCSFVLRILDREPPTVTNCDLPDQYFNVIGTSGVVTWKAPTFTDNVGIKRVDANLENGKELPATVYYVQYTALDVSSNAANCKFFVHVQAQACQPDKLPGGVGCGKYPNPDTTGYRIFLTKSPTQAFYDQTITSPFVNYVCTHTVGVWKLFDREVQRLTDCVTFVPANAGVCPANHELSADKTKCLLCPQGRYFDATKKVCAPCPIGKYQDETGQATCKSCDTGTGTTFEGATSKSSCSANCLPGFFSSDGFNRKGDGACKKCPIGSYQPDAGKSSCKLCPLSASTQAEGSKVIKDCILPARIFKEVPRLRSLYGKEGDTLEISCLAYGIPIPRMRITGKNLPPAQVRGAQTTSLINSQSPYIIGVKLTITKATFADTAEYDCVAENNFGTVYNKDQSTFYIDVSP